MRRAGLDTGSPAEAGFEPAYTLTSCQSAAKLGSRTRQGTSVTNANACPSMPPSHGIFLTTLLALALAGCQTIKPLPPTGRVIPCSTVDVVRPNVEAVDHMTERVAKQSLGNDLVIEELCARKKK